MMIWIRLFWWMVWRAVLSGAASGALFGTVLALVLGAAFGLIFGAILGLITGILNGFVLAIMTRIWFTESPNSPRFREAAIALVVVCTALTSFIVMNLLFSGFGLLTFVPTTIASVVLGFIARRFPEYAAKEFRLREYPEERPSRKAQIVW